MSISLNSYDSDDSIYARNDSFKSILKPNNNSYTNYREDISYSNIDLPTGNGVNNADNDAVIMTYDSDTLDEDDSVYLSQLRDVYNRLVVHHSL